MGPDLDDDLSSSVSNRRGKGMPYQDIPASFGARGMCARPVSAPGVRPAPWRSPPAPRNTVPSAPAVV